MTSRALPILALMLSIGIFFAYVKPNWTGPIAAAKSAIAANNAALSAAADYKTKENALASERAAIDPASLSRLSIFLPDSVDNVGIILDLNALAARSAVSLVDINVTRDAGPAVPTAGTALPADSRESLLGSVDLSMSVVGTYEAFQNFLRGIEQSARLLDAIDIEVKGSDTGVYTYQMTLRLYWLR